MNENELANAYVKMLNKWYDETPDQFRPTQDRIWELAKSLAKAAQPKKKFAEHYNSEEGKSERKKLIEGRSEKIK